MLNESGDDLDIHTQIPTSNSEDVEYYGKKYNFPY